MSEIIRSHIDNHVHMLIDDLRSLLLLMAAKTQKSVDDMCVALENLDFELPQSIIDGDQAIDDLELEIDSSALSILARTQPVASDLRLLISAIRLVVDLERIGDEAAIIAERLLVMMEQSFTPFPEDLIALSKKAQYMLEEAITSFREQDTNLAVRLRIYQDEAVQMAVKCFNHYIESIRNNTLDPWLAMHYILITRALERVAGRAVNVAEHTYFLCEGVNIKHRPVEEA